MKLLKIFKEDKISFILLCATLLLEILGLVFYVVSQNVMEVKTQGLMMTVGILAIVLTAFILVAQDYFSLINIAVAALIALALVELISSQIVNLGYYFAGIEDIGFGLMPTFVVSFICYLLAIVSSSIAVFKTK